MHSIEQDWIETRALARALGVTVEAALNWHRARTFPQGAARKVGRRIFWHQPTVASWREWRLAALEGDLFQPADALALAKSFSARAGDGLKQSLL